MFFSTRMLMVIALTATTMDAMDIILDNTAKANHRTWPASIGFILDTSSPPSDGSPVDTVVFLEKHIVLYKNAKFGTATAQTYSYQTSDSSNPKDGKMFDSTVNATPQREDQNIMIGTLTNPSRNNAFSTTKYAFENLAEATKLTLPTYKSYKIFAEYYVSTEEDYTLKSVHLLPCPCTLVGTRVVCTPEIATDKVATIPIGASILGYFNDDEPELLGIMTVIPSQAKTQYMFMVVHAKFA